MNYRLISYSTGNLTAAAGLLVNQRVHRVSGLSGLSSYHTMLDLLNGWSHTKPLLDAAAQGLSKDHETGQALADVSLLAPVPRPGAVFCAGANFADHIEEMRSVAKMPSTLTTQEIVGDAPWHFLKTPQSSVVGPGSRVSMPEGAKMFDWEIELVAVIGVSARSISVEHALEHVAGYTIGNDLSVRDKGTRPSVHASVPFRWDWIGHKCFDGSFPCGPCITPADQIPEPQNLNLKLWVNDKLMQDSNTDKMIFNIAQQISHLSKHLTLNPGDLIATGTPAGVGSGRGISLAPGDQLRLEIEHIGELQHSIAA